MTITEWTNEDSTLASAEGWDVFDSEGSANGPWQIQKRDETSTFNQDTDAWRYVWQRAERGSLLHQRALEYIKEHNPPEYDAIRQWVGAS